MLKTTETFSDRCKIISREERRTEEYSLIAENLFEGEGWMIAFDLGSDRAAYMTSASHLLYISLKSSPSFVLFSHDTFCDNFFSFKRTSDLRQKACDTWCKRSSEWTWTCWSACGKTALHKTHCQSTVAYDVGTTIHIFWFWVSKILHNIWYLKSSGMTVIEKWIAVIMPAFISDLLTSTDKMS